MQVCMKECFWFECTCQKRASLPVSVCLYMEHKKDKVSIVLQLFEGFHLLSEWAVSALSLFNKAALISVKVWTSYYFPQKIYINK